jgi:hypothetical protein
MGKKQLQADISQRVDLTYPMSCAITRMLKRLSCSKTGGDVLQMLSF